MFERLKAMFGRDNEEASAEEQNSGGKQTASEEPSIPVLTADDLSIDNEGEDLYEKTVEEMLKRLEGKSDDTQTATTMTAQFQFQQPQLPPTAPTPTDSDPVAELKKKQEQGEDITLDELISAVTTKITQQIMPLIQQQQTPVVPEIPVNYMAEFMVERLVKRFPQLQSVSEDALNLVSKFPPNVVNENTVETLMWLLKGLRSDKEIAEKELSAMPTLRKTAEPIRLPYTNQQIAEWAERIGVAPEKLKRRLAEELLAQQSRSK